MHKRKNQWILFQYWGTQIRWFCLKKWEKQYYFYSHDLWIMKTKLFIRRGSGPKDWLLLMSVVKLCPGSQMLGGRYFKLYALISKSDIPYGVYVNVYTSIHWLCILVKVPHSSLWNNSELWLDSTSMRVDHSKCQSYWGRVASRKHELHTMLGHFRCSK